MTNTNIIYLMYSDLLMDIIHKTTYKDKTHKNRIPYDFYKNISHKIEIRAQMCEGYFDLIFIIDDDKYRVYYTLEQNKYDLKPNTVIYNIPAQLEYYIRRYKTQMNILTTIENKLTQMLENDMNNNDIIIKLKRIEENINGINNKFKKLIESLFEFIMHNNFLP
jgi:hypothetical protein